MSSRALYLFKCMRFYILSFEEPVHNATIRKLSFGIKEEFCGAIGRWELEDILNELIAEQEKGS